MSAVEPALAAEAADWADNPREAAYQADLAEKRAHTDTPEGPA